MIGAVADVRGIPMYIKGFYQRVCLSRHKVCIMGSRIRPVFNTPRHDLPPPSIEHCA
jgi:hypothetical protein